MFKHMKSEHEFDLNYKLNYVSSINKHLSFVNSISDSKSHDVKSCVVQYIKINGISHYTLYKLKCNSIEVNKIQHILCGNNVINIATWNKDKKDAISVISRIKTIIKN